MVLRIRPFVPRSLLVVALAVGVVVSLAVGALGGDPVPVAVTALIVAGVLALQSLWLVVVADEHGLLIRNVTETRLVGWDEVEGFRLHLDDGAGTVKIYALLGGDEIVPLDASMRVWPRHRGRAKLQWQLGQLRSSLPREPREQPAATAPPPVPLSTPRTRSADDQGDQGGQVGRDDVGRRMHG